MQTKLRRIDELMRSEKTYTDGDYTKLQRELEDQFGGFHDENAMLKERIRKLQKIKGTLSSQVGGAKLPGASKTTSKGF